MFKVPQTSGQPGWLVFTYEKGIPVCLWVTTQECRTIQCVVDERLCGDTIIRAEKVSSFEFVLADIFIYNSNCLHACSTFKQRYDWLKTLMDKFMYTSPGLAKFIHKSQLDGSFKIKGYEAHPYEIESPGYFIEEDEKGIIEVVKLSIPDCYEVVSPNTGYLRVPDIKTSFYLRSKGERFKCKCSKNDDGSWTVLENIPHIK